ncbi:hypothetical protein [Sporisorium scitamineum]|uniref:RRM domain-containing protein n=1 Tax=Sporisorium scitamineum TaxID=49012 RepID=A0A0F7RVP4_9BASI|nr:hypothetical protein [Sporisorium scitamineum]
MAVASTSATTSNGNGASPSSAAPSPTLYIKNIEGKIKKPELRRQLYSLFSSYGRVLDIVATRAPSMRGQAFVVFETPTIANAAKRALSGFSFYGKGLDIEYSTGGKSRALLRRELGEEAVMEMELEQRFVDITEVKNEDDTWSATIKFDSQQTAQAAQSALHGVQLDPMYTLDLHVS